MLNRRILRTKAFQTIYAIYQSEASHEQLAREEITEAFQPDLNSMQSQDIERLEGMRKLALLAYEETLVAGFLPTDEELPKDVRNTVEGIFQQGKKHNQQEQRRFLRGATLGINALREQYLQLLFLLLELAEEATASDERRLSENAPNTAIFAQNSFVLALTELPAFQQECIRLDIKWTDSDRVELIRPLFKDIRNDEIFLHYCGLREHTTASDAEICQHIAKNHLFKNELIKAYFEAKNISWDEDRLALKSMVVKTIKSFQEGTLTLQNILPNPEEDLEFFKILVEKATEERTWLTQQIDGQVTHWDGERIAMTDKILLALALTEMVHFPAIPVKVTINEFIEIAKQYSTPKSGPFLNGVLDALSSKLKERIRKSGRGLMDNR